MGKYEFDELEERYRRSGRKDAVPDEKDKRYKKSIQKRRLLNILLGVVIVVIVIVILFLAVLGTAKVSGSSMYPTYVDGERVMLWKVSSVYDRGEVVAVKMPTGDEYIKRVVAVPGDEIEVRDGSVWVNGTQLEESYAQGVTEEETGSVVYPLTLGEDEYFVLGDNREESIDSRAFGAVKESQIIGRVIGG